jgi:voltage-dependent potassium channel beta subunit
VFPRNFAGPKTMSESEENTVGYKNLGATGLRVSRAGLGSWKTFGEKVDEDTAFQITKRAWELGVRLIDTAEAYAEGKAESMVGAVLKRGESEGLWKRQDWVIITKLFISAEKTHGINATGVSRKHVFEGMRGSLERLGLDYVDVVLAHRPDPYTPIEETVRAFNHCIDHSQALYWGTSQWTAAQIEEAKGVAQRLLLVEPVVEQPEYNIFTRDRVEVELEPLYRSPGGLGLTTYSPLSGGVLTGKYHGFQTPEGSRLAQPENKHMKEKFFEENKWQIEKAEELDGVAKEASVSLAQLAIAWAASNERVSCVLLGASSVEQLEENVKGVGRVSSVTDEIKRKIEDIVQNKPEEDSSIKHAKGIREVR